MNRLVAAILLKAIDDLDNPSTRSDVEEFLKSEWFCQLAEILELEPQVLQNKLIAGDYERLAVRAAYR